MSNRIFQGVMQRTKETVGRTVGVIDENGIVVASSDHSLIGESRDGVKEELAYSGNIAVIGGYTYRYIGEHGEDTEFSVFVEGGHPVPPFYRFLGFTVIFSVISFKQYFQCLMRYCIRCNKRR